MSLLMGIVNRRQKKEIRTFLDRLNREPRTKLAERLLMLYSTRCIRLFPSTEQEANIRKSGKRRGTHLSDRDIDHMTIYIYHYQKGNEVAIIELMERAQRIDPGLWASLNMHFYTNLATSYEGYESLIRDMWNKLFEGSFDIERVYSRIFPDDALLDNRDITKGEFFANPRLITPHFFLIDSPITRELDERRAIAGGIAGR